MNHAPSASIALGMALAVILAPAAWAEPGSDAHVPARPSEPPPSLETTLERLRQLNRANQPAPVAGSDQTGRLDRAEQDRIADQLRGGWTYDAGAARNARMTVTLLLTLDADGNIRSASIDPADQPHLSDPAYRAFAERALRAATNPRVGPLRLPKDKIFDGAQLRVRFRP